MYKASEYPLDSNKILNNIDKSGTIYSASFHPYTHHTINKTHDVFMGTVGIIPPSLQRYNIFCMYIYIYIYRTENISKDIEMFTSTDRRHYIGREYAHLKDLYITGQYNALIRYIYTQTLYIYIYIFSFIYFTIRDILSRECNEHPLAYEYEKADFLILLDACAVYGIISQDAVFQLAKIHDVNIIYI